MLEVFPNLLVPLEWSRFTCGPGISISKTIFTREISRNLTQFFSAPKQHQALHLRKFPDFSGPLILLKTKLFEEIE